MLRSISCCGGSKESGLTAASQGSSHPGKGHGENPHRQRRTRGVQAGKYPAGLSEVAVIMTTILAKKPGDSMPRAADAVSSGYRNIDGVLDGGRTRQGEATWNDALNDRLVAGQAVPVIRRTFACIAGNDAPEPNPVTGILAAHARRNSAKCHAAIDDAETQLEWPSSTRFAPCARAFSRGHRFPGTCVCGYAM